MKKLKKYYQETSAAKVGIDVKTARKYIKSGQLPSDMQQPHTWKTHPDIFESDWPELVKKLEASPKLQAHTLMGYLIRKNPEKYKASHERTLYRRVRDWRATYGASKAIIFCQDIKPGKQSQSDYTNMNSLNITIHGQPFKHLLFHFMLPYSHWEAIYLCFSESLETLVAGYEKAVWELGYVAREHRTDNLTAATKAMGDHREFTERFQQFMAHYGVRPTTNNIGVSHENGSVEKSHDTLKNAIEQILLLRGCCDFPTQQAYLEFVEEIVKSRNTFRQDRLLSEIENLAELPDRKWHSPIILQSRVSSGSVMQILNVPYTVPSRLIHYMLKAYIYPDEINLFYGNKLIQRMPRVYSNPLKGINYRHIIDSLVRKPGAFKNYRYHEALFPRRCFRQAYDILCKKLPATADKIYLKLLQLAKIYSEEEISNTVELLLETNQLPTVESVKKLIDTYDKERLNVRVNEPNLKDYDSLFSENYFSTDKEYAS
jgi:hypothetical protein